MANIFPSPTSSFLVTTILIPFHVFSFFRLFLGDMQHISFCVWLITLILMSSRIIHVYLLFKAELYANMFAFIYSSVVRHLGSFCVLVIVSNVAMNMGAWLSLEGSALTSFGCITRRRIAGSCGSCIFHLIGNSILFFIVYATVYIPISSVHGLSE